MQHGKLRTDRCPWFIDRFFQLNYTYISSIVTAGLCSLYNACESTSRSARREPTETENTDKNDDTEPARGDLLRDMSEWLEEFTENLVDERVPAHRDAPASSSRESASEPLRKVVSGKHSIYTHFPRDRNCDICMKTEITRAPCRKRTGTAALRADNFGDLITADHKVLSEGCQSRNNYRYAVVVQDLATRWTQSYPWKTKTSQETEMSLRKFLEPPAKP